MNKISRKEAIKDMEKMRAEHETNLAKIMEQELIIDSQHLAIDNASRKYIAWINFINDKYPNLWEEFKEYNMEK